MYNLATKRNVIISDIYIQCTQPRCGLCIHLLEGNQCTQPRCGLCIHLLEGNTFKFNCGVNFKVHEDMTCEVKNVIYVMKCRGCGEEYIGETGNFLRKRVTVHNQQIRDPHTRMLRVSGHIDEYRRTQKVHLYVKLRRSTSLTP